MPRYGRQPELGNGSITLDVHMGWLETLVTKEEKPMRSVTPNGPLQ